MLWMSAQTVVVFAANCHPYFVYSIPCSPLPTQAYRQHPVWSPRLVHYTTQNYFEHQGEAWNHNAQEGTAITCLSYLSFHNSDTGHWNEETDLRDKILQNPFLDYAARHWGIHAHKVQQKIENLALRFPSKPEQSFMLNSGHNPLKLWTVLWWPWYTRTIDRYTPCGALRTRILVTNATAWQRKWK